MAKFKYLKTREMEPRPGVKYSTTYYTLTPDQLALLLAHCEHVAEQIVDLGERDTDIKLWAQTALKGFPRQGANPNYTPEDIICDLIKQLIQGKDPASGLLGRWNRLFADTAWAIELVEHTQDTLPTQFSHLFANK